MEFLKTVGGKIVSGLVAVAVIAAAIFFYRMDPVDRSALLGGTGKSLGWFALVAVAPWATLFLSTWVAKFERNWAGAALVFAYTAAEATMLAWLFNWGVSGATAWIFFAAAVMVALLYNVLICDFIADRFGGGA